MVNCRGCPTKAHRRLAADPSELWSTGTRARTFGRHAHIRAVSKARATHPICVREVAPACFTLSWPTTTRVLYAGIASSSLIASLWAFLLCRLYELFETGTGKGGKSPDARSRVVTPLSRRLSFEEIRAFPPISGRAGGATSEAAFTNLLRSIFERHNPTIVTMARGIFEFRRSLGVPHGHPLPPGVEDGTLRPTQSGLEDWTGSIFLTSLARMCPQDDSISSSCGRHPSLPGPLLHVTRRHQDAHRTANRLSVMGSVLLPYFRLKRATSIFTVHEPPVPGYVGIVDTRCSPHRVISAAADDARSICELTLGEAPDVKILGSADSFEFAYVPSYMRHVCFEVCKKHVEVLQVSNFSIDMLAATQELDARSCRASSQCTGGASPRVRRHLCGVGIGRRCDQGTLNVPQLHPVRQLHPVVGGIPLLLPSRPADL